MALSAELKARKQARWLVVSHDASRNPGRVTSSHKSYEAAHAACALFQHARRETVDEVVKRLNKPELPEDCYFRMSRSSAMIVGDELSRLKIVIRSNDTRLHDGSYVMHITTVHRSDAVELQRVLQLLHVNYVVDDDPNALVEKSLSA